MPSQVDANLAAADIPLDLFDTIVSADAFERLKPSPGQPLGCAVRQGHLNFCKGPLHSMLLPAKRAQRGPPPRPHCAQHLHRCPPHPSADIFLAAAHNLGVDPANCVVIEDAVAGVAAARAAGMRVIGVTTTLAPDAMAEAAPDRVFGDVRSITLDDVRGLRPGQQQQEQVGAACPVLLVRPSCLRHPQAIRLDLFGMSLVCAEQHASRAGRWHRQAAG